jgi:hypothetical protein
MIAHDPVNEPTKVFPIEPIYVKASRAIAVKIRNRFPAPKIDGQFIVEIDIGGGLPPTIKQCDFASQDGS